MNLETKTAVAVRPEPVKAASRPQKKVEKKSSTKKSSDKKVSSAKKKSSIRDTMKALAIATPIIFTASNAIAETNTSALKKVGDKYKKKADAHGKKAKAHGEKAKAHGKKALQHRENAKKAAKSRDMHRENGRIAKDFGGRQDALKKEYIAKAQACFDKHGDNFDKTMAWKLTLDRIAKKQEALTKEAFRSKKTKVDDGFAILGRKWLVEHGVPATKMPTLDELKAAAGARSAMLSKTTPPKPDPKTTFQSKTDSKG